MFGNIKGWGISAGIVVAVSLLIILMGRPPQISPPTNSIPLAMTPISDVLKDADPAKLEIEPPGTVTDEDAHEIYVKVIEDYKANHFKYDRYSDIGKLWIDKPEFLQWMLAAADCKKASLFSLKPGLIISFENEPDSITALREMGKLVDRLGLYLIAKTQFDDADRYLKAGFILGERLYYERLRFMEFTAGTELMTDAAGGFVKLAEKKPDAARVEQLQAFQKAIAGYNTKVAPVWMAISGIGGNPLNNAGDIFDIAANSKERMWRIEATLKLGRMHYMDNVSPADQRGAVRVLKDMADNADLIPVRTAAEKGRDLKVEEFRKFGG